MFTNAEYEEILNCIGDGWAIGVVDAPTAKQIALKIEEAVPGLVKGTQHDYLLHDALQADELLS